jgi:RHS repeat-associated protein
LLGSVYINITHKSDIGSYTYSGSNPHQVLQAGEKTFTYDLNGNMTNNNGTLIDYTAFNKPSKLKTTSGEVHFSYDTNNQRYKKKTDKYTSYYLGKSYEQTADKHNNSTQDKYFIYAEGKVISIYTNNTTSPSTKYLHYDSLNSVDTITNNIGVVEQRMTYKPFGEKLNLDKDGKETTTAPYTNRGYTGHEHIQETNLINMNARLYDPSIGRFISADTIIDGMYGTQGFNRYSYVKNNPLKYVDPSGHSSIGYTNVYNTTYNSSLNLQWNSSPYRNIPYGSPFRFQWYDPWGYRAWRQARERAYNTYKANAAAAATRAVNEAKAIEAARIAAEQAGQSQQTNMQQTLQFKSISTRQINNFISYNTNHTRPMSVSQSTFAGTLSIQTGGKFGNGANTQSLAYVWSRAVHGDGGDAVNDGLNGVVNRFNEIDSKDIWTGVKNVNTFFSAGAIVYGIDLDPRAIPFVGGTILSEFILLFSPTESSSAYDIGSSYLVDELILGNGFKSATLREVLKVGVKTYDD